MSDNEQNIQLDDDVLDRIAHKVASLMGAKQGHSAPAAPVSDVDRQVKDAVAAAQAKQKDEERATSFEARLKKIEEMSERKPQELRGITKAMWGSE